MQRISDILGYKFIDIHSHFDHGVEGDAGYIRNPNKKNVQLADIDSLMREYDRIGIECGAYSTYSAVLSTARIPEENDYLHELVKKRVRMRQWVVVHPEMEETFRQVDRMRESELVLGIKIHSPCHGYPILEHCDKIFSFANERSLTVQMHPDHITDMPAVCDRYPNMRLIIAHVGNEDFVQAVKKSKAENIFLDTSGGDSALNNVIEYAVKALGAEKILFGTDTYSSAFQAGRIAFAGISEREKRLILRDNAIRMFPWAFSDKK